MATTEPAQPSHVEITATGNGYRAVIVADIVVFSRTVQDNITTSDPARLVSIVRGYLRLQCDTVESVRPLHYDATEGRYLATGPAPEFLRQLDNGRP